MSNALIGFVLCRLVCYDPQSIVGVSDQLCPCFKYMMANNWYLFWCCVPISFFLLIPLAVYFVRQFHTDGSSAVFFVKGRKVAVALLRTSGRLTMPDNSKVVEASKSLVVVLDGRSIFLYFASYRLFAVLFFEGRLWRSVKFGFL